MKIYQVTTLAKPTNARFPHYANLVCRNEDHAFLRIGRGQFNGQPFARKWHPIELYVSKPRFPRPDFYDFGVFVFVCNERARTLAAEPLEMAGEFLPVTVEKEHGTFYIYNVTNCINVLDHAASQWESYGSDTEFRKLIKPSFIEKRFGEESLFKFPEDGGTRIYCLERTGEPEDGEFKAVVEQHGLTGLGFELVWTSGG